MPNRTIRLSRAQIATITEDPQAIKFFEALQPGPLDDSDSVTVGVSPYTYLAERDGVLIVQGGTVSAISYVRNSSSINVGVVAGAIPLLMADAVTITYTVLPTVTFLPS
jgi:hypothetical protein